MAKFDVRQLPGEPTLVIDCQADFLSALDTRFVIPLMPADGLVVPSARLNPIVEFAEKKYAVYPQAAANVDTRELGKVLGSLAEYDLTIGNALDMLNSGF